MIIYQELDGTVRVDPEADDHGAAFYVRTEDATPKDATTDMAAESARRLAERKLARIFERSRQLGPRLWLYEERDLAKMHPDHLRARYQEVRDRWERLHEVMTALERMIWPGPAA